MESGADGGSARAAAFFDVDGTVVAGSSTHAFGRELYREGLLTRALLVKGAYASVALARFGASEERMERSRVALLALTKGWEAERVRQIVRETLREVIDPLVYAEALGLFAEHRAAGRALYFVSAAGVEVVEPLAEYLGVDHVLASRPGLDAEGRYDGTLDFYCYGAAKAEVVRTEAARQGLDLAACHAYSDSVTDVPLLAEVGHPVAVNPDRALRATALARGWDVRDFSRPVPVRERPRAVPRPPAEVVAGAGALGALALAGALYQRRAQRMAIAARPARPPRPAPSGHRLRSLRRSALRSARAG